VRASGNGNLRGENEDLTTGKEENTMKLGDYVGMSFCLVFGCWWLFLPRSVMRFHAWFHGRKLKDKWAKNPPSASALRIAGAIWIALVLVVTLSKM